MSAGPYGALLDAVRGVRWPAARRVMGATLGAHPSQLRGNSSEFSEFRPYRQGDDPRRLDWRLLARSDRAYVRLTTDRATMRTSIIVDASASMAFPQPALDKWRHAREIAIGLAAVAHSEADPVGLAIASERPIVLAPRARRSVLLEMMRSLDATTPAGSASLAPLVSTVRAVRVVVVTDLLGDMDALLTASRLRIATRSEVIVVHVVATEELDPPGDAVLAVDPEAPAMRRVLDGAMRAGYVANYTRWLDETAASLRSAGVRYVRAPTSELSSHVVRRIAGESVRRGA
ncbi:MAG: DUF58 domain-containing protein [Gemmatimonadaceae bacterium]